MSVRHDVLFLLLAAAACLAALLVQSGISPFARNLLVVGMFTSASGALALRMADRGTPSGLPMIGVGVLLAVLGPLYSRWIYGDDFASVLRLEYPLRSARMMVHAGYSFILTGALLPAYLAVRKPAPHGYNTRADDTDEQPTARTPLQKTLHDFMFSLKVGLLATAVLLVIVWVAIYLRVF